MAQTIAPINSAATTHRYRWCRMALLCRGCGLLSLRRGVGVSSVSVTADLLAKLTRWTTVQLIPALPGRAALSRLDVHNWASLSASSRAAR